MRHFGKGLAVSGFYFENFRNRIFWNFFPHRYFKNHDFLANFRSIRGSTPEGPCRAYLASFRLARAPVFWSFLVKKHQIALAKMSFFIFQSGSDQPLGQAQGLGLIDRISFDPRAPIIFLRKMIGVAWWLRHQATPLTFVPKVSGALGSSGGALVPVTAAFGRWTPCSAAAGGPRREGSRAARLFVLVEGKGQNGRSATLVTLAFASALFGRVWPKFLKVERSASSFRAFASALFGAFLVLAKKWSGKGLFWGFCAFLHFLGFFSKNPDSPSFWGKFLGAPVYAFCVLGLFGSKFEGESGFFSFFLKFQTHPSFWGFWVFGVFCDFWGTVLVGFWDFPSL